MARMEFLVLILHIVVAMLLLVKETTAEEELPIFKEGCIDRCGRVKIPYPFGIGSNCYANQNFAITCNSSKPFLSSLNLEVLYIYLGITYGQGLLVSNPINHTYMNLSGTPFSFSSSHNLFVGVGCNMMAQMLSPPLTTIVAQCTSICSDGISSHSSYTSWESIWPCYGVSCCQSYLPPLLKVFNVSFSTIGNSSRDRDLFTQKAGLPYKVESKGNVPVHLIWKTDEMCYGTRQNFTSTVYEIIDYFEDCSCEWQSYPDSSNPYLQNGCPTDSTSPDVIMSPKSNRTITFVFVGVRSGLGGLFMIIGAWWLRKIIKRRNKAKLKKKFFKRNGGLLLLKQLCSVEHVYVEKTKLYSSKELETATDHYNENRVLGRGGQGTVYKGMLTDGKIVAVKKSKVVDERKLDAFINEVVILSQINHRNVVKLHGCCLETEVPLLVYDFIPNGTLFQYIHQQENEDFPLTLDVRLRIACEVAGALSYLHSAASAPIYHPDIKSSNILLDVKYKAKVADFGTSRSAAVDQTHMTTRVQGTFGYLDPEYYQSSQFTAKSDVYSFGVVLVELLTGHKAVLPVTFVEGRSLVTYFMMSIKEKRLFDVLDAQILKEGREGEIVGVAFLANRCLNLNGRKRPTMKEVAMELEAIKTTHEGSVHFQVQHDEEIDDCVVTQLDRHFDCTASTSVTSLVGR